jgi:predicted CXXCH cytochrome family protein
MIRGLILLVCMPLLAVFAPMYPYSMTGIGGKVTYTGFLPGRLPENPKCTDCHSNLVQKQNVHSPAKEACTGCHRVNITEHSQNGSGGLSLAEKMPQLCYTCHDGEKKDIDTSRVVHQAVKDKKQCMNCHSPHSSDEKKLLTMNKKELCLGCHNRETNVNGRKIQNISELVKTSKVIHPALNGGCTSCHKPHASAENFLLISAYPTGQYAPGKRDNYAICWECHDSDLLEVASTSTATSFRDGERNLHQLHLTGEKGRTCSVCHDMHATNKEHLVADKITFGEWAFQINYVHLDSGGSCSPGCHQPFKYTR